MTTFSNPKLVPVEIDDPTSATGKRTILAPQVPLTGQFVPSDFPNVGQPAEQYQISSILAEIIDLRHRVKKLEQRLDQHCPDESENL